MNKLLKSANKGTYYSIKRYISMEQARLLNFINGKRVSSDKGNKSIKNFNPATGEILCDVSYSNVEEVNNAVMSAFNSFPYWSKKCPRERGQFLSAAASKIRSNLEKIAEMEVADTGKPIWEARVDIAGCADVLEYYGGIAASIKG